MVLQQILVIKDHFVVFPFSSSTCLVLTNLIHLNIKDLIRFSHMVAWCC